MATTPKKKKFDATLSIEDKLTQVLMGLEYQYASMLQERLTEVFNTNKKDFAKFIDWLDSEDGEYFMDTSMLKGSYLLQNLLHKTKAQFETDVENGDAKKLEETASYMFDAGMDFVDYEWNEYNRYK